MEKKSGESIEVRLQGIAVSPGVVSGKLVAFQQEDFAVVSYPIEQEDLENELARFETALVKTREQLQEIERRISSTLGERDASIFQAHLLVLEDETIVEAVKRQLKTRLRNVECIYNNVIQDFVKTIRGVDDPYLQERATDLIDVARRVLNNLMGRKLDQHLRLAQPSIIIAEDLTPSDTALLDRKMVLGFATEGGSSTSHTAIMARSLNIPAVVGIKDLFKKIEDASGVLLDGYNGTLVLNPTAKTSFEYGQVGKQRLEVEQQLKHLVSKPARTWDDRRIIVSANMDLVEELPFLETNGAEGIGLFRTEMLFLNRLDFPDEEEQYEVYRKVIQATGDHGTIIRTLDLGGDKLPATGSMIHEANPFLGWRAIRYCLQERNIFKAQLRAIARAAHGYRARIMFPMIATLEELLEAKIIWKNTLDELDSENLPRAQNIELGMMIEVPSAALIADQLVEHVDFFSVGTNDLIGYTLAMDRANSRVSYLYQPTHPAILRLLRQLTRVAHDNGRWVGVCGEAASDVRLTPLFVGLGIDELSMGAAFISRVKKAIHDLSYKDMSVIVDQLCDLGTSRDVDQKLNEIVQQYYPELLI